MFKKMTCLISFVLPLVLFDSASAQILYWDAGGTDKLWSTPANWSTNTVPTGADDVSIDEPANTHCVIQAGITAQCVTLRVGNSSVTTNLDISGGSLSASGAYVGVDNPSGHGILNMSGGLFSSGDLHVGLAGTGTLNMTGGTIEVVGNLVIPDGSGTGSVSLRGGTIKASNLRITSASGSMNITEGTLILAGDDTTTIQTYIDKGWITTYGGYGTLQLDYDVTDKGKTTLKAVYMLNPNPANGSSVNVSFNQLQWTLPDPKLPGGLVTCDVYFGTNPDVEANPKVVIRQAVESVSVTLAPLTTYYWALDLYDSSISTTVPVHLSPILTFNTMNQPPIVNAGADVVTWLEEGVVRTGNLDATVTDDGGPIPYTVHWTVVSEPNAGAAAIATANAEDTRITLTGVGQYVLKLEAFDGEYTSSDTVTINVYNDSCEAAKSLPNYQPLVGDLDGDCQVDAVDFALLAENWLKDNTLAE
jgi:hypothetical protein